MKLFDFGRTKRLEAEIQKAIAERPLASQMLRQLYRYLQVDQPIWLEYADKVYIEQGYERNAGLFAIVNKVSSILSNVPYRLVRIDPTTGEKEEVKQHEILKRWEHPNPDQSNQDLMKLLITYYMMTGNAYLNGLAPKSGENRGKMREFHVMPSQYTEVIFGGWRQPVKGYVIEWEVEKVKTALSPEEVLHWRTPNLDYRDGHNLLGMSPVKAMSRILTSSNSALEAKVRDFQSGGLKGFLSADTENPSFTQEQIQDMARKLRKASSLDGARMAYINDKVKWNEVGLSVVDMAILDSLNNDFNIMCDVFGVNPGLFSADTTFENQKMYMRSLYTQVGMPMLQSFYSSLNRWWVCKIDPNLRLEPDYSNIPELQEDLTEQANALSLAWWITPNQRLSIMGLPKVDDEKFDEPWIPLGLSPMSQFQENLANDDGVYQGVAQQQTENSATQEEN